MKDLQDMTNEELEDYVGAVQRLIEGDKRNLAEHIAMMREASRELASRPEVEPS